jgi:hypothetical protein
MNELDSIKCRLARLEAHDLGNAVGTQQYTSVAMDDPLNIATSDGVTDVPDMSLACTLATGIIYRWQFYFCFTSSTEGFVQITITDTSDNALAGWNGRVLAAIGAEQSPSTGIVEYIETGTGTEVTRKCRAECFGTADCNFTGDGENGYFSVERTG